MSKWKAVLLIAITISIITPSVCLPGTVSIKTPDPCVKLDRVENDRIYLVSGEGTCIQTTGIMQVQIKDGIDEVAVHLNGKYWNKQKVSAFNMDNVSKFMEAQHEGISLKVPDNIQKEKAETMAGDTDRYYRSDEFQAKLGTENGRLRQYLNIDNYYAESLAKRKTPYYSDYQDKSKPSLKNDERLYIFISSSVPIHTIRNYALRADKLQDRNIVFVMRGFINGARYTVPTIRFIAQIMKKSETCDLLENNCEMMRINVMIDPLLFAKYGVERVPAFVYARGVKIIDGEMSEGLDENASASDYYKLSGDAGLDHIFEKFYEETKSSSIKGLLYVLGKGFY